ncbi:MAG: glycosyltransferase family 4 protein [Desulfobacterium sp.]|jgi:glycosyltransferase involved in cell wall biosynthesis|nr:glycosyltransferase family 4 protein [Desulfobacterium sp.]
MRIAFYAPFKPLNHKNPSGDLVIAQGIVEFLKRRGHGIDVQSRIRARWIFYRPWLWPWLGVDFFRSVRRLSASPPDLWLTYHSYYKAPDVLGPLVCKCLGIKYVIFQGIYSTKQRKRAKTLPGFLLNRYALKRADHVITNKLEDLENLRRILPAAKLSHVPPGIDPRAFQRNEGEGRVLRQEWQATTIPVILTAAMFRNDVKSDGLEWLIRCCSRLVGQGVPFLLVIAGSGPMEKKLKALARKFIPGNYRFVGRIPRKEMYRFYSAGDIFAFPGIRESLGMVFLEAQSCSLPVIAFDNGGIPEVVDNGNCGLLIPPFDEHGFASAIAKLIEDPGLRKQMGENAADHIRKRHDLDLNYLRLEALLKEVAFDG